MPNVTIRARANGPLLVEGPVTVLDHEGTPFPLNPDKPNVALCRCGHSARKPFCDGAHNRAGFVACDKAVGLDKPASAT
jgi:CDGSH-type Zn-finger protein